MKSVQCFTVICSLGLALLATSGSSNAADSEILTVNVKNKTKIKRQDETISLQWSDLGLSAQEAGRVMMRDNKTGLLHATQAIDMDGDGAPDELIFQASFAPREKKSFTVQTISATAMQTPSKVHAKFVPTRFDDFAWENDRIAFRMYGPALQNTNTKEKLISSGIDVWTKRVRKLVLDDWYQPGVNYHKDTGEGLDFYKVGPSRGCGGLAIWDGEKMHLSQNYTDWKIIADGPMRTVFELTFAPWEVNGKMISEIKRITLDAGSNLNRFDSFFKTDGKAKPVTYAVGLHIAKGEHRTVAHGKGELVVWEPSGKNGNLGMAVVANPSDVVALTESEEHDLLVVKTASDGHATFYAGAGWDKSGDFSSSEDWSVYVAQFAQRINSPLVVSITRQ